MPEPINQILAIAMIAARTQLSVYGIAQALIVAAITAATTTFATVRSIDDRMREIVQDVREIKAEHGQIRERLVRVEQSATDTQKRPAK